MTEMENNQFYKHLLSTIYMPSPILEGGGGGEGLAEVYNYFASLTLKKNINDFTLNSRYYSRNWHIIWVMNVNISNTQVT